MSDIQLKPWARGPYELIKHADGHLKEAGDIDRRLALIGFDNAIEVCIDVFLRLHPKLRHGYELANQDVERALRNYHTKIEFLDSYVAQQNIQLDVSVEVVVWYHSLRNELYHSGNGMVPEIHVIEGAKAAALSTFKALFGIDIAPFLGDQRRQRPVVERVPYVGHNDQMEFLRVFIDFERSLQASLRKLDPGYENQSRVGALALWRHYTSLNQAAKKWDSIVESAVNTRNNTAHGRQISMSDEEILTLAIELMEVAEALEAEGQKRSSYDDDSSMSSVQAR
jgi:hypothetical protein